MQQVIQASDDHRFYATVTQDASVYQNIGVTGNFDWNIIIDIADNMFIIWPISQYYFITSIQNCRSDISLIVVKSQNYNCSLLYLLIGVK